MDDLELANMPHVETVRKLLLLARFTESQEGSAGFRVWPSAKLPDTVYVDAVRSADRFDYESTFKACNERIDAYLDALMANSFDVARKHQDPINRLVVRFVLPN